MEDNNKLEYASPELVEQFLDTRIVLGTENSRTEKHKDSTGGDEFEEGGEDY